MSYKSLVAAIFYAVLLIGTFLAFYFLLGRGRSQNPYIEPVSSPACSTSNIESTPSHTPHIYPYTKPLPTYFVNLSQWQVNLTQGESFQVNITITSFLNQAQTFTPTVQLAGYANAEWDPTKDSHKVYNATLSQEQLVLEPHGNATTILTINIAQDAPLGRYLFYVVNDGLEVMVFPKTN